MKRACVLIAVLSLAGGAAGAPPLDVPEDLPGAPGTAVPPNLLLALSLTYHDAAAAYSAPYDASLAYDGYFNPRLCYTYPTASGRNGSPGDPDLSPERGFFSPRGRADAQHRCSAAFSGNFLNWAATSRLDLLRLGLTGGDRFVDTPERTILQRAVLPEGAPAADFYAHPVHFPRKSIASAEGVTPFGAGQLHVVSCRDRILFSRTAKGKRCDAPRRGKSGRLLVSDQRLGEYAARVMVCDGTDAADRPGLCRPRGGVAKPEGVLQELAPRARVGVMSYLTGRGLEDRNLYGGVLRAPLKQLGAEWSATTGVLERDPDGAGTSLSGAINYINQLGRDGSYKAYAPTAELFYESLRYLQGRAGTPGASDGRFPVFASRPDPLLARCQRNAIAVIAQPYGYEDRFLPGNWLTSFLDGARAPDSFAPGEALNIMTWTDRAGLAAGVRNLARTGAGPEGTGSFYLAGAALWSATRPIRPDADGSVDTLALQMSAPGPGPNPLALAAGPKFFDGSDAGRLRDAVARMARRALQPQGTVTSAATASSAGNGDGFILLASYDRSTWSGDLARFDLSGGRMAPRPSWQAAAQLPAHTARDVFTTVERDGSTATVQFEPASMAAAGLDADLVRFVRGDRREEGKAMRARAGLLGDIVRSAPLVVGAPATNVQGEGYAEFRQRHAARPAIAYVGANDGMLHGFDAASGAERLAYIPRALHNALPRLAAPDYAHTAWMDGSPGAGEAHTGNAWRTVLSSGFGMGAKGVFSIDITRPDAFLSGAGELWQFSDTDDRKIGHVFAAPVIARLRISARDSAPRYRYFAMVTSGLNNYSVSAAPDGALFLLALDKPQRERWRINVNYYRFDTPALQRGAANALGPLSVVVGADGSVTHAYAGDLQGRLWRFDFSGTPPWRSAASALFSARDDGGVAQPITMAPRVVYAPDGGHLVVFGTGRMLEARDALAAGNGTQSLYAVHDTLAPGGASAGSRGGLAARRLERDGAGFVVTGEPIDYGIHKGWYFDFADSARSGERMTATPMADGGVLVASSTVPGADQCSAPASRTYVLSVLSGMAHAASTDAPAGAATATVTGTTSANHAPVPALLVHTGTTTATRDGTGRTLAVRRYSFVPVAPGGAAPPPVSVALPGRRLSWREITNWQELHDAAAK